jgi:hypothetical protein
VLEHVRSGPAPPAPETNEDLTRRSHADRDDPPQPANSIIGKLHQVATDPPTLDEAPVAFLSSSFVHKYDLDAPLAHRVRWSVLA